MDGVRREITCDPRVKNLPIETGNFFKRFADIPGAALEVDPELPWSLGIEIRFARQVYKVYERSTAQYVITEWAPCGISTCRTTETNIVK